MDVSSAAPSATVVVFPQEVLLVDATSNLHLALHTSWSRRVEGRILEDNGVPWGHQVAVNFLALST